MTKFEIDISGEDIFNNNYTVCIADSDKTIKGFKIQSHFSQTIHSCYLKGLYRYKVSKKDRANFKIRLYTIIIYYLFKSINLRSNNIELSICRDFDGKEEGIKSNLQYFLSEKLDLGISKIEFCRLSKESNAHNYAYLMRKDTRNKMQTYVNISIKDVEKYLKK